MVPSGFPGSSAGKESACNAGDPSSIPGSGRSPGGGHGNSIQYSWASLVSQTVKNLPAMWETWVQSLLGKSPWEEDMITHSTHTTFSMHACMHTQSTFGFTGGPVVNAMQEFWV